MTKLDGDQVSLALVRILERLAFVLAEPWHSFPDDLIENSFGHAQISFAADDGTTGVDLILSGNTGFLTELAASILGLENDEVDDCTRGDALLELANVIGGEIVMMLGGESIAYTLSLPKTVDTDKAVSGPSWGGDVDLDACAIQSEEGYMHVAFAASQELEMTAVE